MSSSNEAPLSPRSQLALSCFEELLDCAVADVASDCHRIARLGLDRSIDAEEEELRVWATRAAAAPSGGDHHTGAAGGGAEEGGGGKGGVDVFGQTHPAIAADVVECMNCGRPVVAGRFAPHLEKCMGKVIHSLRISVSSSLVILLSVAEINVYNSAVNNDIIHSSQLLCSFVFQGRKARTKTTRSSIAGRTRSNNGSAASSYSPYPSIANTNRASTPNGVTEGSGGAGRDHRNGVL
ncbi:hypothetical protein PR202_ga04371 [Eleusine coracana subsp. coracana]|uniref:SAGA-associated factor 11 n=1 Tax=Eleusine coracana subsp. coracana TaxID=191504 RepID=A0AAV5BPF7_ELECO|nr:hypothetical protein PR202_ga04371 [Eleusine coracana subsp. coracana]